MKQLLNERNKELAALMIKKHKTGKLNKKDTAAYEAALARFNARANANRRRLQRSSPIDWESGKDARAEGHIATATRGVKKPKRGEVRAAAKAHGEKVEESSTGREKNRRRGDAIIKKSGGVKNTNFDQPVFKRETQSEQGEDSRSTLKKAIAHKRAGNMQAYKRMIRTMSARLKDKLQLDHQLGTYTSLKKKIELFDEIIGKTLRAGRRFAGGAVDLAGRGTQTAGTGVDKTGQGIEKGGKFISKKTGQAVSKTANIAGTGIQKVGGAVGGGVKALGKPVGTVAKYGSKAVGSTMRGAGHVSKGAGKLVGKGGRTAGMGMMKTGAAMSSTGLGAIAGVPLAALGALTYGAGTAGEVAGRAGGAALKGAGTATKAAAGAIGKTAEYGTKLAGQTIQTGSKVAGGATKLAGKAAGAAVHGAGALGSMAAGKTVSLGGKAIKKVGQGVSKVGKAVAGDSAKAKSSGPTAKKDVKFGPGSSQVARYTQSQAA